MKEGYIVLHRKILDNKIWKEPTYLRMFIYLLLKANHNDFGSFKRGQHYTSYTKISSETGFKRHTISKCLRWLSDNDYIRILPSRATRVEIVNYDKYQPKCP